MPVNPGPRRRGLGVEALRVARFAHPAACRRRPRRSAPHRRCPRGVVASARNGEISGHDDDQAGVVQQPGDFGGAADVLGAILAAEPRSCSDRWRKLSPSSTKARRPWAWSPRSSSLGDGGLAGAGQPGQPHRRPHAGRVRRWRGRRRRTPETPPRPATAALERRAGAPRSIIMPGRHRVAVSRIDER